MVNEKNNGSRNTKKSCPQKDGFFIRKTVPAYSKLTATADGSLTVTGPYRETYHSLAGAVTESEYVYIACGLRFFIESGIAAGTLPSVIHILEMGLGTGLNAFLACKEELPNTSEIFYRAVEKYPLLPEITDRLGYAKDSVEKALFQSIHSGPWGSPYPITERFTLCKLRCDFLTFKPTHIPAVHVVFYDAFSPAVQPLLWTESALLQIFPYLATGAVLTTYSCTGSFRRVLETLGFTTERLPGTGKKRQILRAVLTRS
ncbi:MAG: tRNA (5-methylaminomethyl-2-thiouridine)(34)-methyltransferase MnmD [Bacteroidales bacterium]|nr:tRNA (5-methylaminomethyl-2-thiouridine)(34)-methyltransferase MnmD [Bacteroidales bacterium]